MSAEEREVMARVIKDVTIDAVLNQITQMHDLLSGGA